MFPALRSPKLFLLAKFPIKAFFKDRRLLCPDDDVMALEAPHRLIGCIKYETFVSIAH